MNGATSEEKETESRISFEQMGLVNFTVDIIQISLCRQMRY